MERQRVERELAGLAEQDGWQTDEEAARVHYEGETDRYSIEYYPPNEQVLYWRVAGSGDRATTAVPVPRERVPAPLRERIRADLRAAGVDPAVERREC